jgi:endonuclease/exonuclease/phosphatase family metal-dependent hydrolase
MAQIRAMSWNLKGATSRGTGLIPLQLDVLRAHAPDLLVAQEVTREAFTAIAASGLFASSSFALNERGQGTRCDYGVALFASANVSLRGVRRLTSAELADIPEAVRERARDLTLTATATAGDGQFLVASFHVPAAQRSKWGWRGKRGMLRGIARFLATSNDGLIGVDANGPKFERLDVTANEYWREGRSDDREEYLLHDPQRAPHAYRDALRLYLESRGGRNGFTPVGPEGPLAVSHLRRYTMPCRYDFIFTSGLAPTEAPAYPQIGKASDHAPVIAKLALA